MVPAMRWSIARFFRAASLWLVASAALACSGAPPPPARGTVRPPPRPSAAPSAPPKSASWLSANLLAQLEDEKSSPYFARRGSDGVLLYSAGERWLTRAVGADGKPKSAAPVEVGPAANTTMAVLKAAGDGYLVVFCELVARNRAVKLLALDTDGKPRGEPLLVTQIVDEIAWVDILPNAEGSLVLWDVPHDDRADVFMAPILGGKVAAAPSLVAPGVIGWEAVPTERGAVIATVITPPAAAPAAKKKGEPVEDAAGPQGSKLGIVLLTEVDRRGKPGAPVTVSAEPSAQVDVEIVEVSGKYVLAWTDERHIDACVYTASVDPGGKVSVPAHRATPPIGEQALVALVSTPYAPGVSQGKRALVAWEDLIRAPREGRLIHLATLGADGALGKERATLAFSASGPPDLVSDGEGFAALTLAPFADVAAEAAPPNKSAAPASANKKEVWPAYVRFGPDLSVLAAEPIRAAPFGDDGLPELTWGLTCAGGVCTTLASGSGQGAPVAIISLPNRMGNSRAPAWRDADDGLPRPVSVTALFDGDHLAKVAAVDIPSAGSLAAWVTYYLEGATVGGKKRAKKGPDDEGPFATLGVRPISADGAAGKTTILSRKALSIGGVALAPVRENESGPAKPAKKPEAVIAWVARERGEPQVFVTKVGADGAKLAQKGVTVIARKKPAKGIASEASDVAIADSGDGFIVAWVDTRDGNAEIYVAKVDRGLTKVIPDRRITEAPGDSAEVQIAVRGQDVFLVWSDARQNPDEGSGDIYLSRLDAATLKKAAPETRLFSSALHSRTPQITSAGSGFLVSWIEDAFGAAKGDAPATAERGLRVAQLDAKGSMIGVPQLIRGEGQAPVTSAAIGCPAAKGVCRGVLTSAVGEALVLGAFSLNPGTPPGALKTIAALTGTTTQDVSPVFANGSAASLFFADDAVGGSGRVRWMQIAWP
jgi:hypothetical protein